MKYNLNYRKTNWMKTLAIEADTTVSQLKENEQSFMRQAVANNVQKLIKEEATQKLGRSVAKAVSRRLPIAKDPEI
jgi:hypothetical protein